MTLVQRQGFVLKQSNGKRRMKNYESAIPEGLNGAAPSLAPPGVHGDLQRTKRSNGKRRIKNNESAVPEALHSAAPSLAPPELHGDLQRIMEQINLELPSEISRTIVVTGAQAGVGVSRFACWLAGAFAQANLGDVLYLNAGPAPLQHAADQGNAASPGLLDLVREPDRCKAIYRKSPIANLFAMRAWPNANADMLHVTDQQIVQALAMFRNRFAYVVIDAPAPLVSPLTLTLARLSGGTLVVVEANKTDRDLVAETGAALGRNGARIIGAIVNKGRMR